MEKSSEVSQIKFDKNFIKKLLSKLKVGNTRSIHLNAIPGRSATRLDLYNLASIDPNIPSDFIETILNNEVFSFLITFDKVDLSELDEDEKIKLARVSKRLNNIVIENVDNYLEFGIKNFGFGYPLLIKRDKNDPSKIIKAPLFIWHLDIERSYQNKNSWTIKKEEGSPIKINELLIAHLAKDEKIQIDKISKEILEDGILDKNELVELSATILAQLNVQNEKLQLKTEKCPDAKQIEAIANSKPWIQWSGIFGIYRSQKETIIHATEELLEQFEKFESEDLILEKFQTSSISAVETDPSKEEIVNTLTKDEIKLIQGPPGTGKSQSITAIVSNALANNAKCLIVCEKKTALDVIQANLVKTGLSDFSVVIDDVNKDRKKIIKKSRNIKEAPCITRFSQLAFETKYEKFIQLKKEINSKYAESLQKIFGDFSWKQLIGLYLKYSKSGDLNDLITSLNYEGLEFNHEEYSKLISFIEEAGYLFCDLENKSDEIFAEFSSSQFSTKYKLSTHEEVKGEVLAFRNILEKIKVFLTGKNQNDCEEKGVSLFKSKTIEECYPFIEKAIENSKRIYELFEKGTSLIGHQFNDNKFSQNIKFKIFSIFSTKYREVCEIRKNIYAILNSTIEVVLKIKKYDFDDLEIRDEGKYDSFKDIKSSISEIYPKIIEISFKTKKIMDIERELKKFETEILKINEHKIFDIKFSNYIQLKNYEEVLEYYSELREKIELIQNHLDSYESYHNWKFFCRNKNKFELHILSTLKNIQSEKWKDLFAAWYYRGALLKYEETSTVGFHKSDSKLKHLEELYDDLGKRQIEQIKSIWGTKRRESISTISFNFNTLYNFRRNNAGPKNSLRKIIEKDFDLFTALFPVILTNPSAANAILPLEQGLFNIVIFDEASQLKIHDTFTSFIRGQYKIIAGDEHQMPPSNYFQGSVEMLDVEKDEDDEVFSVEDEQTILAESESLLQYANTLDKFVNKSSLDFHYRSNHPALIEFSNCAFYGGNLIPFPPTEIYTPIEFRTVNGRYESRTNPAEVSEVLGIINNEIHPNQKGYYPSVGIATFNINQRNLITEALNTRAELDETFSKKYQELNERGLFVKNLENIQGDERDIIIISTTFGVKSDGTFSQNFARLNRIEGYKLLNVLITRAKNKLYVCTSIPKEKYLSYFEIIKNEGNNKKGILYAYLAYAEAISNHDIESAEKILKALKTQSYEKPRLATDVEGLSESPFEEEVYELLIDNFEKSNVIQQHKVGGFRLDFVIKTENKNVVLECDGKSYHQSEEAYSHDMYRQKELEKMGFIVYRIWSTNWFQDKSREMEKLLMFMGK